MLQHEGPAWDNTSEYPAVDSAALLADIDETQALITKLEELGRRLGDGEAAVRASQSASKLYLDAARLLGNVDAFLSCELSVDGKNAAAKALASRVRAVAARLGQAYNPFDLFLKTTTDAHAETYLQAEHTKPERFSLGQDRLLKDHALSLAEEDLILALGVDGISAWGTLYDNLSGSIRAEVSLPDGTKSMGLSEVQSLAQNESEAVRKAAWKATNAAWEKNEEAVAAGLNALAGWRHTVYRRRSQKKPLHFLDMPLHQSRIRRETLEAMLGAVHEARELGHRSLKAQARLLGKEAMAPWDLAAPVPKVKGAEAPFKKPTFDEAVQTIADAYGSVHPEMGDFVKMMQKNRWIEGRVGATKRPGAYCTGFVKSRTPRVYMTYNGGMREVMTLAHELGHAFHSWVMRDMPIAETHYPMTLAETASIFGETVLNNYLLSREMSPAERLGVLWTRARDVDAFVLNIPARFEFEKRLYEKRQERVLSPDDLKGLMTDAWASWYGPALTEMDPMFWASKLHFSIADLSFYNFPYTFGYLFALGVYAQRATLKDKFFPAYVALLRDTGRMTAEDVAQKHLGADLTRADFWRQSLEVSRGVVEQLEAAAKAPT